MISAEVEGSDVDFGFGRPFVDEDEDTDGAGTIGGKTCGGASFDSAFFLRVMAKGTR